ncbi:hypothetical protein [Micrococcus lylae]|uniref:Uncharacterized protein n=1 Tax=Micrococcus lylae TaxID=1273 RepID=A0ABY2JY68_9MICC|nr:hypothetical protein [Micrococcus lylae]TFH98436.1 hypothetical protein E4A49_08585 [Micrococcus lylae]
MEVRSEEKKTSTGRLPRPEVDFGASADFSAAVVPPAPAPVLVFLLAADVVVPLTFPPLTADESVEALFFAPVAEDVEVDVVPDAAAFSLDAVDAAGVFDLDGLDVEDLLDEDLVVDDFVDDEEERVPLDFFEDTVLPRVLSADFSDAAAAADVVRRRGVASFSSSEDTVCPVSSVGAAEDAGAVVSSASAVV